MVNSFYSLQFLKCNKTQINSNIGTNYKFKNDKSLVIFVKVNNPLQAVT